MPGVLRGIEATTVKTTDLVQAFTEPQCGGDGKSRLMVLRRSRRSMLSIYEVLSTVLSAARNYFTEFSQWSDKAGITISMLQKRKLGLRKFKQLAKVESTATKCGRL